MFSLELPKLQEHNQWIFYILANLAGYKAVIEAFQVYEEQFNDDDCSRNNYSKSMVGARVAGLQAIATAKRMGAVVLQQTKNSFKRTSRNLGGKFLTVEGSENLETEGGYAKEASEDFKKQEELLSNFKKD